MPRMMRRPTFRQLARAAQVVGHAVGSTEARYCFGGQVVVPLSEDWQLALSPDDAGRFRVRLYRSGRLRATMWCRVDDESRLADLASAALSETAALAA